MRRRGRRAARGRITWLIRPLLLLLLAASARADPYAGEGGAPAPAFAEWADWLVDARVASRYDSNLNRASQRSEEEWDFSFEPALDVGRVLQLGERTRLSLTAGLAGELPVRAEDLTALVVEGRVALVHKLGLGDAPWLRLSARGGQREVRDGERSGANFALGVQLGKRFSPRLDASLRYEFTRYYGGDGDPVMAGFDSDVFDQRAHQLVLEAGYLLTPDLLLNLGMGWRYGDFDSNAQASRMAVLARAHVGAVARDDAFGGWVYRVEGSTWSPQVRLNQALSDRWSLDLGYRFQYAEGGGLRYRNHAATAAVLFRY